MTNVSKSIVVLKAVVNLFLGEYVSTYDATIEHYPNLRFML